MAKSVKLAKVASKSSGKARSKPSLAKSSAASVGASKGHASPRGQRVHGQGNWATDLVFDVREPKLAVSLRLDADVLRFFRGFGAGYQTRINEVLKAFMHARAGHETGAVVSASTAQPRRSGTASEKKRAR